MAHWLAAAARAQTLCPSACQALCSSARDFFCHTFESNLTLPPLPPCVHSPHFYAQSVIPFAIPKQYIEVCGATVHCSQLQYSH